MPRKGYKCITFRDRFHEEIRRKSKDSSINVKEYTEYVIAKKRLLKLESKFCSQRFSKITNEFPKYNLSVISVPKNFTYTFQALQNQLSPKA